MSNDVWRRVFGDGFVFTGQLFMLLAVSYDRRERQHTRLLAARLAIVVVPRLKPGCVIYDSFAIAGQVVDGNSISEIAKESQ